MQQITIVGHLGQDCKIVDHMGKRFTSFSVAVTEKYTDAQGQKVERTVWYECTMDKTNVADYLKKGTQVLIQGNPKYDVYYSERDGKWYPKIRVATRFLQLLGSATDRQANLPPAASPSPQPATSGQRPQSVPTAAGGNDGDDNDLPF